MFKRKSPVRPTQISDPILPEHIASDWVMLLYRNQDKLVGPVTQRDLIQILERVVGAEHWDIGRGLAVEMIRYLREKALEWENRDVSH